MNQEQPSLANFGPDKHIILITNNELPSSTNDSNENLLKARLLLAQRIEQEIVRIQHVYM